jgi:hypothetical protein
MFRWMRVTAPAALAVAAACVPSGSAGSSEAGASAQPQLIPTQAFTPSQNVMTTPFEDNFDRPGVAPAGSARPPGLGPLPAASGSVTLGTLPPPGAGGDPGPDWMQADTNAWHIETGRLCVSNAHNHGIWLNRTLPVNARIEFDAIADTSDGDLKAELWGDGRSAATSISYTNATSYLAILGGWHNKYHVLARINEHGKDRKEISVDPNSDDARQRPVVPGQIYRFKVERADGKTVRWSVNDVEFLSFQDASPLAGAGHDHFGFNDWEVKVCFDNVRVTPLP